MLIALVGVAQRLPWLLFTLPAGVITDRVDRRKAMILMDVTRGVITAALAIAVAIRSDALPAPNEIDALTGTDAPLYAIILVATLLLGMAEVLRDNSAQTLMPSLVEADQLERANGRLWSAESTANTFVGPPLGSVLLSVAFALPIVVDAASFFAAAALVLLIPGTFRATAPGDSDRSGGGWRVELAEGFGWLWRHPLLRPMAIILGLLNLAGMLTGALLVLYVQDVFDAGTTVYTIVGAAGAVGAITGGTFAAYLSRRLGAGTCLALTLAGSGVGSTIVGFAPWWPVLFVVFAVQSMLGTLWNVITVSLRQAIIPRRLLGRVNSVYRFFAWGMMPLGALLGGIIVSLVDIVASREYALRSVWFVSGALYLVLFVVGRRSLTTERIETFRRPAAAAETALPDQR